ncbi:uncharacterized protein UMAG_05439 [Mycosarcoma maydis]|uniref:AA10 family lytic polysaccharide monooxygenase C n=1 Tax=Mycosarcoma maydis TaxID=5270 RepID=LP10_MYCMD|nr:uncharacterized protein UMAG_05439 [Ustilago maydis 521]KIS66448.1 hypothetical protein UMAG_05439 [Ustilago maydis 521]|eukprot:XP_011391789.1 hypothetical protein UMAG_05439 [Ustilago maydis 521]
MVFSNSNASVSLFRLVALVATLSHLVFTFVDAHGYVTFPASRAYMCKQGQAKNCGEIQYEPQSVEAPKGLPFARKGDGQLCSAGLGQFSQLDRQGPSAWPTTKASGVHSFSWTFTAQHATTDFKYFITKANWDSSKTSGLSASDLESDPFLTVSMNGKAPPRTMNHDLSKAMPSRSGYHVVYAVWTVDNTANAFYQCLDLDFGGGNSSSSSSSSNSSATSTTGSSSAASAATSSTTSSSVSESGTASTASGSGSDDDSSSSGDSSNGSSSDNNGGSSGSTTMPKSQIAQSGACRMKKRRRSPNASVLAARGDYRRHKSQMRRDRQG